MAFKTYSLPQSNVADCVANAKHSWSQAWFGLLPDELQFEAETHSKVLVRVVGFQTKAPYTSLSWVTLDNIPSFLVCRKTGKTARNHYKVGLSAWQKGCGEWASQEMAAKFQAAFQASPYASIRQEHLRKIAKGIVARMKGRNVQASDTLESYAEQNPYFEEELANWNRAASERREDAQRRIALAREASLVSFDVGLNEKLGVAGHSKAAPAFTASAMRQAEEARLLADSRSADFSR